ncbi:MAG: PQQ-binding-like beta-propeller repeat protein [Chloroflexota bacterium]
MGKLLKANTGIKSYRFWLLVFTTALLLLLSPQHSASAQTDKYWEFETQGRLLRTHTADLDRDGIDEVILMDDSQTLTMLGADGQFVWSVPIPGLQVLDMIDINTRPLAQGEPALILATPGRLIWVNRNGDLTLEYDLPASPLAISTVSASTSDTVLVATSTGLLEHINGTTAERLWQFENLNPVNRVGAEAEFVILPPIGNDLTQILFSVRTEEDNGELTMLDLSGTPMWSRVTPDHQRAMVNVPVSIGGEEFVATGSAQGRLALISRSTGAERWFRTPNRPITSMQTAVIGGELGLIIGTDAGTVLAYTIQGRRLWDREMGAGPEQGVIEIEVDQLEPDYSKDSVIMIELEPQQTGARAGVGEIVIPGPDGRPQGRYPGISEQAGGELTDLNNDGFPELLLTAFSTVSLQDAGADTEVTGFVTNWTWRLEAAPSALLEVTSAGDQTLAIMVAGEDGLLHNVSPVVGLPVWQQRVDGTIEYLESVFPPENPGALPDILVGWNRTPTRDTNNVLIGSSGGVDLKRLDGTSAWDIPVQIGSSVTVIEVDNNVEEAGESALTRRRQAQIYIGTQSGEIFALSYRGELLWERDLGGRILDLEIVTGSSGNDVLAASTSTGSLSLLSPVSGSTLRQTNRYGQINQIIDSPDFAAEETTEDVVLGLALFALGSNARLQGLDADLNAVEGWITTFSEPPQRLQRLDNSLLATWNSGQLVRLSLGRLTPLQRIWTINGAQQPAAVMWQDIDGDGREDLVTGGNQGTIGLYSTDGESTESVELASPIFDLGFIGQQGLQSLIAIGDNGILTSLSARPNRPPFLANAVALPSGDQYSISVTANDIDGDIVSVILQVWDEDEQVWRSMGERDAPATANRLVWNIDLPEPDTPVRYRFFFDDGTYAGSVEPAPGVAIPGQQFPLNYVLIGAFLMVLVLLGVLLRQFIQAVPFRGRRLYSSLTAQPELILTNLNQIFRRTTGSADLLLNISGRARRDGRAALADLCDGLYLLPDRPGTAIEILSQSLDAEEAQDWVDVELWRELFELTNELYSTPSIVELGLFIDRLEDFLPHLPAIDPEGESYTQLAAPMEPLEAVGRVEMARDRIAFLQEGQVLLQQEENTMMWRPYTISNQLALALNMRWQALSNATIEELRGRPWLIPSLKTRRMIAAGESVVALELLNNGQAAAENINVNLEEDPAYSIVNAEQSIPFLAVGRTTTLEFKIMPHEPADLRLAFEISFQDAAHRNHGFDFADMATMISADRPFSPVRNPYAPGTPLRRQSPLFYGRKEILEFIIETIQSTSQSNVIVLVGQRRTGKTSTLLHLSDVSPPDVLPVYVDCQSLGVSQGMTGFLYDLAWFISDALVEREIDLDVPDLLVWEKDPSHYFQRKFLPRVYELLPYNATLLLVFDEFEAFEEMIGNGTLPQTFFSFLRHLMQHGGRLNFVFAGTHRLEEMGTDYWSVLFNIALYRQIDYLDQSSAYKLVTQPVEGKVLYDDLALDKIWRVTAGHPYFLQLVCYTLINYANRHKTAYITIADVNEMLREMLRLGEVHFAYLWQFSSFAERAVLIAMAHLHESSEPVTAADVQQSLRPFDLDLLPGEITGALRRLVSREILSEYRDRRSSIYEMRVGLVQLWVEENRNLSTLFERKPV